MSRRGRPPFPDVLTPRQQEVLEYVRQGLTNDQIAQHLGISPDGVKFHVSEILSRTGKRRRGEAAEWSRERERPTALLRSWRTRGVRRGRGRGHRRSLRTIGLEQEAIAC
ncbi:MAG: helix-turn-helix transcriptional regulator [Dehalococcoidia bacterium]